MARHEDMFGNVKIPRYEALNTSADDGGWRNVPRVLRPEDYASLIGLHVAGLPRDQETVFNLESTYLTAHCSAFVQLPYSRNWTQAHVDNMSRHMQLNLSAAAAAGWLPGQPLDAGGVGSIRTWFISMDAAASLQRTMAHLAVQPAAPGRGGGGAAAAAQRVPEQELEPALARARTLVFGALYISADRRIEAINLANCTLRETHVESAVECAAGDGESNSCRVRRQRLSRTDARPPSVTLFDHPRLAWLVPDKLPERVPGTAYSLSLVESFIADQPGETLPNATGFADVSRLSPTTFSERFSLLLNTYLHEAISFDKSGASALFDRYGNATLPVQDIRLFAAPATAHVSTADEYWQFVDTVGGRVASAVVEEGLPFVPAAVTASALLHTPIYVCHFAWLAILLLAAAALLATGAASLLLQLRGTLAPDMLRYVASLTYANPNVRTPPGAATLDGMERARLLSRMPVRICDVRAHGNVGEVAFVASDEVEGRALHRDRFYA